MRHSVANKEEEGRRKGLIMRNDFNSRSQWSVLLARILHGDVITENSPSAEATSLRKRPLSL